MYICVTHVDARTKLPCTVAPMSHGPAFPDVKGLHIEFGNQTQWPTNEPLFFGTCDDDADISVQGVIKTLTPEQYAEEQVKENETKAMQVREQRMFLLQANIDSLNPIRWESFTVEEQTAWKTYRQALLDIPEQADFPWDVQWPTKP